MPHQLHDVNLATGRPPRAAEIFTEHPKRRPDALALRQLGPDVYAPVLKGLKPLRLQPSRSVPRAFLPRGDGQIAISYRAVFRTVGVILPLVVAPSGCAEVVRPVAEVHTGAVKFIRPHQGHALVRISSRVPFPVLFISRFIYDTRECEREEQPGCVAIRIVPLGVQDQCGLIHGDNVIHQTGIVGSDERARARSISRKQCKGILSRGASAGEELGGRRGAVVCNLRVVCKGIDNGSVVIGG